MTTVTDVNPKNNTISLKGPKGNVVVLDVKNPDHFKVVKKGDKVEAVYTEALAISEVPRAVGRWENIRVFYPNINLWNDHPLCLLDTEWVTPEQKAAAKLLADYLMTPKVQQAALKRGYRPGNLDVPVITADTDNPFNKYKDIGIKVDVNRIAAAPDGAVLEHLMQTFTRNTGGN